MEIIYTILTKKGVLCAYRKMDDAINMLSIFVGQMPPEEKKRLRDEMTVSGSVIVETPMETYLLEEIILE